MRKQAAGSLVDSKISDRDMTKQAAGSLVDSKISDLDMTKQAAGSLVDFKITDLATFTREQAISGNPDFHLFYVGRDDVHGVLKYVLSRVTTSLYLNMFGYDDDELNKIVMSKVLDPHVIVLITLDKSQSGGKHEKMLLAADKKYNLKAFGSHFVVGQSATHQISHTKGFVADGRIGAEGSTNWSSSGEGTFVVAGKPGGPKYKAQNNTQSIFIDQDNVARFQAELVAEHAIATAEEK